MKKLNSLILNSTVNFLDFIYSGRSLQRFWVLEVIARSPYFAFLSVLHFKESLGIKNEKTMILMKEHFYQAINETEHLKEMEKRGGDRFESRGLGDVYKRQILFLAFAIFSVVVIKNFYLSN